MGYHDGILVANSGVLDRQQSTSQAGTASSNTLPSYPESFHTYTYRLSTPPPRTRRYPACPPPGRRNLRGSSRRGPWPSHRGGSRCRRSPTPTRFDPYKARILRCKDYFPDRAPRQRLGPQPGPRGTGGPYSWPARVRSRAELAAAVEKGLTPCLVSIELVPDDGESVHTLPTPERTRKNS